MVEEIKSLRRNKKVAGIEDPIVIVQRLLNVFRQLHILDEKQRTDFETMVLQQPPEIRHMCSALPGGSLLQEFVDELEEKHGIAPDQVVKGEHLSAQSKENILANALADDKGTISQEAPTTPVKAEATPSAVSNESIELQKQMLMMMQAMQAQNSSTPIAMSPSAVAIQTDPNFAKDIATAISTAMAESDEKRHQETMALTQTITQSQMEMTKTLISELNSKNNTTPAVISDSNGVKVIDNSKEITKAITESQLEMAKMFLQHNAISASNSNANNANNIQINNTPAPALNTQELIGDIIKAQSQLFREMAKEQTKELSAIISVALKESHQLSNKTLIEALSSFQKENLKFFKQQAKSQTVIYQQAPNMQTVSGYPTNAESVQAPVYHAVEPQFETEDATENTEPSYIKKVLGNMFNRVHSREFEEQDAQSADTPAINTEQIEPEIQYEYVEIPAEETSVMQDLPSEAIGEENKAETTDKTDYNAIEDESYEISSDGLGLSNSNPLEKKKKKKKKKKKNNLVTEGGNPAQKIASSADEELRELLNFDNELQEVNSPLQTQNDGLDNSLFDSDIEQTKDDNIDSNAEPIIEEADNFPKLDMSIFGNEFTPDKNGEFSPQNEDKITESEWEELPTEEIIDLNDGVTNQNFATEDENLNSLPSESADFQPLENNVELSASETENQFGETDNAQSREDIASFDSEIMQPSEAFDILPDEKEEPFVEERQALIHKTPSFHSNLIPDLQNQEAVETLLNNYSSNLDDDKPLDLDAGYKIALDANEAEMSELADDNSEWEWEYEEIPEEDASTQIQTAAPIVDESASEDGEWEWEYEEVPEEDDGAQIQAAAPLAEESASEDGEWEWEYEEVPEEDDSAHIKAAAPLAEESASEDGEWEWEYEEVPEEEDNAQIQAAAPLAEESASEDGEWEWEYEEVPEEDASTQIQTAAPIVDETALKVDESVSEDGEWEYEYEEDTSSQRQETEITEQSILNMTSEIMPDTVIPPVAHDLNDEIASLFADDDVPQSEEEAILPKEQEDVDFSALFENFDKNTPLPLNSGNDPYTGGGNGQEDDLDLTPLHSGSLYFQEDIALKSSASLSSKPIPPELDDEIVIPDLEKDEIKIEPYALNSDIKP